MNNSIFVSTIIKFWEFIVFEYRRSFIKKVLDSLGRGFSYLSKGSRFKSLFVSRDSMIAQGFLYSIYKKIMDFINKILNKIRDYIEDKGEYSLGYRNIRSLFRSKVELLRTLFIFLLSFALGLAFNNIVRGNYSGRSYIVIAFLVLVSIIGLSVKENYSKIIKNSLICRFIYSIFAIEEEFNHVD